MHADVGSDSPEVAHVPQGQASHHGVGIGAVLAERVDGQQSQVWFEAGVGAHVQVDQFLLDNVHRGTGLHHVHEESGDIQALCH